MYPRCAGDVHPVYPGKSDSTVKKCALFSLTPPLSAIAAGRRRESLAAHALCLNQAFHALNNSGSRAAMMDRAGSEGANTASPSSVCA